MSLLHLDSSAHLSAESITRRLTSEFARRWRARHPEAGYRHRDLVVDPVDPIGSAYCQLGRRVERWGPAADVNELIRTPDERLEWDLTRALIAEVLAGDVLLIGAPMYNYSAPAALKAWIDRITFPGAFTSDVDGTSLLTGLRVIVVTACGGAYGPGTGAQDRDFLTTYLRAYFGRQGVPSANIEIVTVDRTLAGIVPGRADDERHAKRSLAGAEAVLATLAGA